MPVIGKMLYEGITKKEFYDKVMDAIKKDIFVECTFIGHKSITFIFENLQKRDEYLANEQVDELRDVDTVGEVINGKM